MNLETNSSNKKPVMLNDDFAMEDFDFKPITPGLGFHQPQAKEVKPVFTEKAVPHSAPIQSHFAQPKPEMNVYQNDLSLFYGQQQPMPEMSIPKEEKVERYFKAATKPQRFFAYFVDLASLIGVLVLVLTTMAKSIDMELHEAWINYPHEVTPLVAILFIGFYMIYFSIFDKSAGSTVGKNLLGIRVVNQSDKAPSFSSVVMRSLISLLNFASLGLFSYFDLQNKVTATKVVRMD